MKPTDLSQSGLTGGGAGSPLSSRLSRRRLLQTSLAALLPVAFALDSLPPVSAAPSRHLPRRSGLRALGPDLVEPAVRRSQNGVLDTSLTAAVWPVPAIGRTVTTACYETSYPCPTLRLKPGDRLRVNLANNLSATVPLAPPAGGAHAGHMGGAGQTSEPINATNLHVHGLHVSPQGVSDNIFLQVSPGQSFQYDYQIPLDTPPGLYWYHPHFHGLTDPQVGDGMCGAIVVEGGGLDDVPGIKGLTERLLVLHTIQVDANGNVVPPASRTPAQIVRTINGQLNPTLRLRPGETQRWRIANASADDFFNLALDGHTLYQIAADGHPYRQVVPRTSIALGPGMRAEVLVQAGAVGTYQLKSLFYDQGTTESPETVIGSAVVEGTPVVAQALPTTLIPFVDLRTLSVNARRAITFDYLDGTPATAAMNGKRFDPNRVDTTSQLYAVEEWHIANLTLDAHPFHLHTYPFQVVAVTEQPYDAPGYNDTFIVPPAGSLTIRVRFLDFTGKTVYHCHILSHEDPGMMAVLEVTGLSALTPVVPEPSPTLLYASGFLALGALGLAARRRSTPRGEGPSV